MPIRIHLVGLILLLTSVTATHDSSASDALKTRPNIVLILADDLGFSDTELYGTTRYYQTPNLLRLAKNGVTFDRAYAASPLCSPTRSSILTGMNPARTGITAPVCHRPEVRLTAAAKPFGPPSARSTVCDSVTRLNTEYRTLGERLRQAGYRTGHFGKWHLGPEPFDPLHHGFEIDIPHWPGPGPAGSYIAPWKFGRFDPRTPNEHIEDRMGDEAVAFIKSHQDEPFFLNYWQFSVHAPFDAKRSLIAEYKETVNPQDPQRSPTYAAMVHSLDDNVGKILDCLDECGLTDNTLVVFYSDNGGNMYNTVDGTTPTSNAPLRGGKATLYEGGVRVPCVIVWPGVVAAGSRCQELIQSTDLYPTLLSAAQLEVGDSLPLDGIDITPLLRGKSVSRRQLFTYFPHLTRVPDHLPPAVTVHQNEWKLIRIFHAEGPDKHGYELYNLKNDVGEKNNLADQRPDLVSKLDADIERFLDETQAVLPLPNPRFQTEAPSVVPGIVGIKNCVLTIRGTTLHVDAQSMDPFFSLILNESLRPQELTLKMRMSSKSRGGGQVYWQVTGQRPQYHKSRRATFDVDHDGEWHEYAISIPAKGTVERLRIDPSQGQGTVDIEWIRLESSSGDLIHEWRWQQNRSQ